MLISGMLIDVDLHTIEINGLRLRVALSGSGPLVMLIHGWPEGWYAWRHQIPVLAAAGYRVAALDTRGTGGSDRPQPIEAYAIEPMCADIGGLITALGERQAIVIGHDWGAAIAWWTALFHPQQVRAVAGLSVPHLGRGPMPAVQLLRQIYKDRFFYQLYFQEPGVAEAELEADVRTSLRKIYYSSSGDAARAGARIENPAGPGFLPRLVDPGRLPDWLTEADLDHCAGEFRASGFGASLNRYRNSERDFSQLARFDGQRIAQPAAFIAGKLDRVLQMFPGVDMVDLMRRQCSDLRAVTLIEDAGHWVNQEKPSEVNAALLAFLGQVRALPNRN
jgi:pimeloyl-ACP methyl ester carboxylesterase